MTLIPDLQPMMHGPASWFYQAMEPAPVYVGAGTLPSFATLYAIGWLGDRVESRGETPQECIGILLDAYEAGHRFSDGTMGAHTCEVCPPALPPRGVDYPFAWNGRRTTLYGHGHHLILHGDSLFMCPAMILHYIVHHQYRPPEVFLEAVVQGRILTLADRGLDRRGY